MDVQQMINTLSKMERVEIQYIILQLMISNKISYSDITEAYTLYLEEVKKEAVKDRQDLQNHVLDMWFGKKKDIKDNLKNTMHWLLDKGWINSTHEKIDNK